MSKEKHEQQQRTHGAGSQPGGRLAIAKGAQYPAPETCLASGQSSAPPTSALLHRGWGFSTSPSLLPALAVSGLQAASSVTGKQAGFGWSPVRAGAPKASIFRASSFSSSFWELPALSVAPIPPRKHVKPSTQGWETRLPGFLTSLLSLLMNVSLSTQTFSQRQLRIYRKVQRRNLS